jgi:subtilisin family serine protease
VFVKKLLLGLTLAAFLPSCGGVDLPDTDGDGIPDIIDPCPLDPDPNCVPDPPDDGAYDCENPPALSGLVKTIDPVLNEYIVVLKEPTALSAFSGLSQVQGFGTVNGFAANISEVSNLVKLLKDPRVAYVQQVGTKHTMVEWGLDRVDQRNLPLNGSFNPAGGGTGVNAAIVDTGVTDHPDFVGRLQEDCFTAHTFGGCTDRHGHGTHVAGTVGGAEFGVAKDVNLYSVRVLNENGSGSDTDVINGIEWVIAKKKADPSKDWVINMSLGGSPAPALDAATCRAIEEGVTVVVAAGNDSQDATRSSPARVKQAVTVAASDRNDKEAYFSNDGPVVDLYAPGVDVRSTKPGGGSQIFSGTSMASPHVAGGAALALQGQPGLAPAKVEEWLVGRATPGKIDGASEDTPNLLLYVAEEE